MAKTTAPLLSFDASGAIAKTQVYSRWRGIKYARRHVIPANPRSDSQTTTRDVFAMLREMWKLAPSTLRDPWNAFAQGRPFTGMNAYLGENMRVVRLEDDLQDWIGSPGAHGALSPGAIVPTTGTGAGEIDVAFTPPDLPSGWSITSGAAVAFPDQMPTADFGGPFVTGTDDGEPPSITLSGLPNDTLCVVAGWIVYEKPNGRPAYSVGVTATATSADE